MELEQKFEEVEIGKLKMHPGNPRNGDIDLIGESINVNGFFGAIVAQRSTGRILAGNHRWKAAKAEGKDRVPVAWVDVDDDHALRILLADNRTNDVASYDESQLASLLAELNESCGLAGTGYKPEDLEQLLTEVSPEPEPSQSQDERDAENEALDAIPERIEARTKQGEVVKLGQHRLHCVDCLELMRSLEPNSIDAVVTDPPYGIGFMGKNWDVAVPGDEFAQEALRVLKPGGHLIAFAATRTVHRLTVAIEDAGFEIRDQIGWLQWQGFPKSLDVSKAIDAKHGAEREVVGSYKATGTARSSKHIGAKPHAAIGGYLADVDRIYQTAPSTDDAKTWNGWGTALKPGFEPAVLARKPLEGTVAENVLKWGTGGLNIDATRIAYGDESWPGPQGHEDLDAKQRQQTTPSINVMSTAPGQVYDMFKENGRWPANIYYCPKPSRGEREEGCAELPGMSGADAVARSEDTAGLENPRAGAGRTASEVKNYHPTVKPTKLMRWLLRLVTPQNAVVLEPFGGSGTTLVAAEREGFKVIAAEISPEYCDIIRARVEKAMNPEGRS